MNVCKNPDWRITINKSYVLKRSLFYHVDKNRDKKVPLKHRGTLSLSGHLDVNLTSHISQGLIKMLYSIVLNSAWTAFSSGG